MYASLPRNLVLPAPVAHSAILEADVPLSSAEVFPLHLPNPPHTCGALPGLNIGLCWQVRAE